jgi:hypothetical protein
METIEPKESRIGERFGSLVVTGIAPTRRSVRRGKLCSVSMRYVRCDCGKEYSIPCESIGTVRECFKCRRLSVKPGAKIGCLTVIRLLKRGERGGKMVRSAECRCDCGNVKVVCMSVLIDRDSSVCTCLRHKRHGLSSKRPENRANNLMYRLWSNVKDRCYNPRCKAYKYYGGRGIKVCARWLDFKNFLADLGYKKPGISLDRIDPDGDYSPENCRWADRWTQSRNRGFNTNYKFMGQTMTLGQWIAKIKMDGEEVSLPDLGRMQQELRFDFN